MTDTALFWGCLRGLWGGVNAQQFLLPLAIFENIMIIRFGQNEENGSRYRCERHQHGSSCLLWWESYSIYDIWSVSLWMCRRKDGYEEAVTSSGLFGYFIDIFAFVNNVWLYVMEVIEKGSEPQWRGSVTDLITHKLPFCLSTYRQWQAQSKYTDTSHSTYCIPVQTGKKTARMISVWNAGACNRYKVVSAKKII